MKTSLGIILLYFVILLAGGSAAVTWDGGGDQTNWFDGLNWDSDTVPGAADDVFVTSGSGGPTLTGSVAVFTLTVSNKTLTFQGTNTILTASNVTVAGTSGKITHSINTDTNGADGWVADGRVWIVCTNLTVAASAMVDVNYRGYRGLLEYGAGYGPGGGNRGSKFGASGSGGGYGGRGGDNYEGTVGGVTNGSAQYPFDPGSGGGGAGSNGRGGNGAGAIRIEASGTVTVNGTITANGENSPAGLAASGGGSGGGIYIRCRTFGGNGMISANGGTAHTSWGGGGGGGRIAVVFEEAGSPSVRFAASGGTGYQAGRPGTLWLSWIDGILPEVLVGGMEWVGPTNTWSPSSFTFSNIYPNAVAVFPNNFQLGVTGAIQLVGGSSVEMGTNAVMSCTNLSLIASSSWMMGTNGSISICGGNVSLSNGATLFLYPEASCNLSDGNLVLDVNSKMHLYSGAGITNVTDIFLLGGSTLHLYGNTTSGVPPDGFWVQDFTVSSGSVVNANAGGYGSVAYGSGYGPGGGDQGSVSGSGGGYGGRGGDNYEGTVGGVTNGSAQYPFDPGSGGGGAGNNGRGGRGGGAVRIKASGTVTVNGTITANGENSPASQQASGGGSGGGIYIRCRTFGGNGMISANGGIAHTSWGGGGGGGRIAVRCEYNHYFGSTSVTNGTGYQPGGMGTIYWRIQAPGTMFSVW